MKNFYTDYYYKENYTSPWFRWSHISDIYYLWIAYFCIKRSAGLKRGDKTLDVGCGVGNLVWALRKLGMDAYGIEPSSSASKYSRVPQYCRYGTYIRLPYRNSSFDIVYSNEVLEHIYEKELFQCLSEMQRVSKGKMIHMVGVEDRGKMITEEPSHVAIHMETWWKNIFQKFGYKVLTGNLFYFFPFVFSRNVNFAGLKKGYFFIRSKK